jgi:hypothetical protein
VIHPNGTGNVLARIGDTSVRITITRHTRVRRETEWSWSISKASGHVLGGSQLTYPSRERMVADLCIVTNLDPDLFNPL